jgi:hypothetical protein
MPVTREAVNKQLARVSELIEDAKAKASSAAEDLVRSASMEKPEDVDPDKLRASADDYASAAQQLQSLREEHRRLQDLLT